MEGQQLGALGLGALHLLRQGGHVLLPAAVNTGDPVGSQADGTAGHVHGHVAAADDHHPLAGKVRHVAVTDAPQQLHRGHHAMAVLALDAGLLVGVGADGQVQAIVFLLHLVQRHIRAHVDLRADFNAQGQNGGDLPVQELPGEAVVWDAVAQHAAQGLSLFIDGDAVAHEGQVIGGGEAAGAAADDGHLLPRGRGAGGLGHLARLVHGVALQGPDIDRVIHHAPAAAGLAGVLADVGAGHREGVVLADQAHRVGVPARVDQGDVAGDVHSGRTQGHAGHWVFQAAQAPVAEDVFLIVVPETLKSHQHKLSGVDADGTVGGVYNGLGSLLNAVQNPNIRLSVQHFPQHIG